MEKKAISIIALDPRAARSYGRDVEGLFGEVADVSVFSVMDGSAMGMLPHADLFAASTDAFGSPEELARHVPIDSQTMAVQASFRWQELRRLKELPPAAGAVCQHDGDHGPGGHRPAGAVRHHPRPLDSLLSRGRAAGDVHIAVTPDEMRYVPEEIETKIDVGQRACTSGDDDRRSPCGWGWSICWRRRNSRPISNRLQPAITALTRCSPAPSGSRANSIF